MKHKRLEPETLEAVADRFKVLAEPARLTVLNALRGQPLSVSDLIDETGLNQANLSKHLQLLYSHGFVNRQRHKSIRVLLACRSQRFRALRHHVRAVETPCRRPRPCLDALIDYAGEEDPDRMLDRRW